MFDNKEIDFNKLKELCEKYDKEEHDYPESEWEGESLFEFICHEMGWNKKCSRCGSNLQIYVKYERLKYDIISLKYVWRCYGSDGCWLNYNEEE